MLGWKTEELIGHNIHHVIHHSHSDGGHYSAAECPIYQAFRDGIKRNVDNEVFWRKDGAAIDVEYTSTPIRDNGQLVGAVVIFRDVTQKRLDQQRLLAALSEVERLKHRLELENAYLQEEINSGFNHHRIVGNSPAIRHVIRKIEMVAPTDATTLICGESGTGKELIARAIHELSGRRDRSLIRVNCAAIPEGLFESEFFGHGKGAFTGATGARTGRFELADGGTLFLDEVGEIPLALQGKLLRVLQEQQFERVGESKTRSVDVRIIAATNRDLKELVQKKEFREDLYFRLNVFPIEAASLRERREDIPLLAVHFLRRVATKANKPQLKIPLSQMEKLQQYSWPGNIRELENVIERQVILARGEHVLFPDLELPAAANGISHRPGRNGETCDIYTETELKENEKTNILAALHRTRGKVFGKDGAAELLDIKPTTLSSRIKKYDIDISRYKHDI
jgi:PAS domain S-box-containing protein